MLDLLFLTSVEGEVVQDAPVYTDIEIYFWYIALAIMIVLTIIFIKSDASDKKKLTNLVGEVNKKISAIDSLINNEKLNKNNIKTFALETVNLLDNADVLFIELKEKTRLDDFNKILEEKGLIVKELKELANQPLEESKKELSIIKDQLLVFKGQLELLTTLIK